MKHAAVAQMDRARASEARGREFDPPQPRHVLRDSSRVVKTAEPTSRFVPLLPRIPALILFSGVVLSLWSGIGVLAQKPAVDSRAQQLYLVAGTLTVKGQPSGYPVTLYSVAEGKLKVVREVVPASSHGDMGTDGVSAPSSICCVPVSKHALYFVYPYYHSNAVSIIHFDDPARVDKVEFNPTADFTTGNATVVARKSASEDELLIPATTDFSDPAHLKQTLTTISNTPKGARAVANSGAWNDFSALQREGNVGGPATQTTVLARKSGADIAVKVGDRLVVVDSLPSSLRDGNDNTGVFVLAVSERYVLSAYQRTPEEISAGKLGDTTRVFVHDREHDKWKTVELEGSNPQARLFRDWLTGIVISWNPEHGPNPGRDNERSEGTDRLPSIQSLYASVTGYGRFSIPGILTLQNLADDRKIRIVTGQEDSEILNVKDDEVFYRVNDTIYKARITGDQLQNVSVVVKDEDVPEVHWIFWAK